MAGLSYFDAALLAGVSLAVTWSLVAMMRARRDMVVRQVREQLAEQAELRRREEKRQQREEANRQRTA